MKITICGSMQFSKKMVELERELMNMGYIVVIPPFTREYAKLGSVDEIHSKSLRNKVEHDVIRTYFNEIKEGDAVLIVNEKNKNIEGYVGGNSFLEMGFAYILDKKIFLLNSIPQMIYTDEMEAMNPVIINRDLSKIK